NWPIATTYNQSWVPKSPGSLETYKITNLSSGTEYWFAIKAHDDVSNLANPSNSPNEPTDFVKTAPNAPQNLNTSWGDSYIYLTWEAPSFDGGLPITYYIIYRNGTSGELALYRQIGNFLFFNDTAVENNITYHYKVAAKNAIGEGASTGEVSDIPNTIPSIVDRTPDNTDVSVNSTITIEFSEAMNKTSAEDAFSISPDVTGTITWTDNTLIFTPDSPMSYSTQYTVTVSTDAKNLVGNNLNSDISWQFTTEAEEEITRPSKPDVTPEDGTINVPVDTEIIIEFDIRMDEESTEGAFSIEPHVEGIFQWTGNYHTLTYIPSSDLNYSWTYTILINTSAKSSEGGYLEEEFKSVFRTEKEPKEAPFWSWQNLEPIVTGLTILASFLLALFGFMRLRRKRNVLRIYLEMIDDTYDEYKKKPRVGEKKLIALRDGIKNDVKKGRLEENHFLILDKKIDDYLHELRAPRKVGAAPLPEEEEEEEMAEEEEEGEEGMEEGEEVDEEVGEEEEGVEEGEEEEEGVEEEGEEFRSDEAEPESEPEEEEDLFGGEDLTEESKEDGTGLDEDISEDETEHETEPEEEEDLFGGEDLFDESEEDETGPDEDISDEGTESETEPEKDEEI
ncbi:MAG: Ig-like domain-containing protein, partial [Thermoplasmata archaeon]